ncbi:hypothetical protein [Pseudoalteromonas peptidolytica]|uniref:Uncharacterized protein n=1 Tax=Pseudoalteromonas peptidolytica F12-50-A1 TaxID=1315280 RepID=A0A8I0MYD8_9GAMM|nr:hypothetical protein [Pseudoalteromonas peptidolytica]MBE0347622.1 hypothetical protein [Pseudoalteromonas peptidolytica F12-50-A1]NLR17038.1 hypothetical protein [Pseudoalteromonas peptidolytica]GEK11532.1 hypothetical protein PPE03_37810 [Pseudoalteromonas peptidolytica]
MRKFFGEGGLELYSSGANVISPSMMMVQKGEDGYQNNLRGLAEGCNIYLICARSRISFDFSKFKIVNNKIYGSALIQNGDEYERYRFIRNFKESDGEVLHFEELGYPDNHVKIYYSTGKTEIFTSYTFLHNEFCEIDFEDNDELEVLYVGQAFGRTGKRIAIDRLSTHKTLQRILADANHFFPDKEIILLMFRFEHGRNIVSSQSISGAEPASTPEEDVEYLNSIMGAKIARRFRVSLAEAALIRYFKPKYNVIYKNTFPSKKHKVLDKLLDFDYSALIVQIDTQNINTKLVSSSLKSPKFYTLSDRVQFAEFPLTNQEERETFLHKQSL